MWKKLLFLMVVVGLVGSAYAADPSTTGMKLWLKGDAGVVANTDGQVSTWHWSLALLG